MKFGGFSTLTQAAAALALFNAVDAFDASSPGRTDLNTTEIDTGAFLGDLDVVKVPESANLSEYILTYAGSDKALLDEKTGYVLLNITQNYAGNDTMAKRDVKVYGYDGWYQTWHQMQTVNKGEWWSPWYPISQCVSNGLNDAEASISVNFAYTYTWSLEWGLNAGPDVVGASIGYSISDSVGWGGQFQCNIAPHTRGQIWYQQRVAWADIQKQDCRRENNGKVTCSPWSAFNRVNAPLKGADNVHLGCSSGEDNIQCDAHFDSRLGQIFRNIWRT